MNVSPVRLAILGCGAITERGHLPAAAAVADAAIVALVDKDLPRAKALAGKQPNAVAFDDYRQVIGRADAAIVALPPALHAPVTIDLLTQGVHVLVEKPMARDTAECDAMIAAAKASGATLAVGLVRRFRWAFRYAKTAIDQGMLGAVQSVDVHEGGVFDWPVASPFFLKREAAGGGVLADAGVHVIDALLWWFGDVAGIDYRDDAFGGVEGDCEADLTLQPRAGTSSSPAAAAPMEAHIALSRTRRMRNTTIIRGERGTLEIAAYANDITLSLHDRAGAAGSGVADREYLLKGVLQAAASGAEPHAKENCMADQLADFVAAVRDRRAPLVPGEEGRRSVAVIEACYAKRKPLRHPWVFAGISLPLERADRTAGGARAHAGGAA
jgi:predicted dehydrogenase